MIIPKNKEFCMSRRFTHAFSEQVEYTAVFYISDNEADIQEDSVSVNGSLVDLADMDSQVFDALMSDVHSLKIHDFIRHEQNLWAEARH